jgi:UDP-2,4-diacetamido-2,4,6-trideoxy-beta-L-altropyranose hydrolase
MKKLIFRADGDSVTGLGHLYRIFAVIEICRSHVECILITNKQTPREVIPGDYQVNILPDDLALHDEPAWMQQHYPAANHQVALDGYQFGESYQKAVKAQDYRLIFIDDLAKDHMYADVVINHALSLDPKAYRKEKYTRLALGTKYALLRPAFLDAASKKRRVTRTFESAFVCFGGADSAELSAKAVRALLTVPQVKQIHVVSGSAYRGSELATIVRANPLVTWHKNLNDEQLCKVMTGCDFAIAGASNILYELCAVRIPVMAGHFVDNQKSLYKGAVYNGLIYPCDDVGKKSESEFKELIEGFLAQDDHQKYLESQSGLFDRYIGARIMGLMSDLNLRKATSDDTLLLFHWANDPEARRNSYFSEVITLETHQRWFNNRLKDGSTIFYIVELEGVPAGLVRYDVADDRTIVGVTIDKKFRGRGFASVFLKATAEQYFGQHHQDILAYIKKTNMASVKTFEKAGYVKIKDAMVHGSESFIYKLHK